MRRLRRRMLAGLMALGGVLGLGGQAAAQSGGYWMVGMDGVVYPFGVEWCGQPTGVYPEYNAAIDIEPYPDGRGYWVLQTDGWVEGFDCAGASPDYIWGGYVAPLMNTDVEYAVSVSATPNGRGLWVFTNTGRAIPLGQAQWFGDMGAIPLVGEVLDSVATPSGQGYYMVAEDGGIFTFGDAQFHGSMGGIPLAGPVMSMAPDPDGHGYWLVATDGGIFSFGAPFYGSMGGIRLQRAVTGIVASPTGQGYLMVAADGGIFTFGDVPFHGSLGASPPYWPVLAVAAKP